MVLVREGMFMNVEFALLRKSMSIDVVSVQLLVFRNITTDCWCEDRNSYVFEKVCKAMTSKSM